DRRAVKLQRLIAASALLCKRREAISSDMWVLRYIWDTNEQIEIIAAIINSAIDVTKPEQIHHPQASVNTAPDADEIFREVTELGREWENADTPLSRRTIIKDRLRYLNGRCEWINNETQRTYVLKPIEQLWQKILQEPQQA
ncbi:MAG TPA: ATPase, partial [Chitinophagales bacterium]|nr:ATPase [Chitinophagales bacterium]